MTNKHRHIVDINDELVRTVVHIDDGRDHTKRHIHRMRRNQHIHEGICPPIPPAPKVAEVKLTPVKKSKGHKRGKQ
ncbi:hypothetical protein [Xenorhabdus ehlersii]|uniref:Uncharacterized protein n=1 Tax=Xenorhabdus ehlersii TaxID=290111 RepID=A0A2D0IK33_9GAMM|nr:hypothetical protein [Xenorhabdus ehlersii]PHM22138.1 hypothetical protein Xehl_03934 [Xenorhabdus ehlersii]RKE88714.1 hypothetical protein BDE27_3366 [Xenorhabdus ehlersii]